MVSRRQAPGKVRTRPGVHGDRFQALYLPEPGVPYVSLGTYDTYEMAEDAWVTHVAEMRKGVAVKPERGRVMFADFCDLYLTLMVADRARTANNVEDHLRAQILPFFGKMKLKDIGSEAVSRWILHLRTEKKLAASSIATYKGTLSGIFTAAIQWGWANTHPCAGVKIPKRDPRRIRSYERADTDGLIAACPGPVSRLLIQVALHSGARYGEITELRVKDVRDIDPEDVEAELPEDVELVYLNLTRAVSDVGGRSTGHSRFLVESTTKGGVDRKVSLNADTSKALLDHIEDHDLGPNDLLFTLSMLMAEVQEPVVLEVIPDDLGRTEPNAAGKTYKHGTTTGYQFGKCKCKWCRMAMAQYRSRRRAQGLDLKPRKPGGRGTGVNVTDHIPRDWFRRHIWLPTTEKAQITGKATFHDLRHTHATWLAKAGVSVEILRRRLGHSMLSTTQKYIDDVSEVEITAVMVMDELLSRPVRRPRRRRQLEVVV